MFCILSVDVRLRKLAEEKDELLAQIRKLKSQLEEERQKHSKMDSAYTDGERMENGTDLHIIEMQSKSVQHNNTCEHFFLYFLNSPVGVSVCRRLQQTDE